MKRKAPRIRAVFAALRRARENRGLIQRAILPSLLKCQSVIHCYRCNGEFFNYRFLASIFSLSHPCESASSAVVYISAAHSLSLVAASLRQVSVWPLFCRINLSVWLPP